MWVSSYPPNQESIENAPSASFSHNSHLQTVYHFASILILGRWSVPLWSAQEHYSSRSRICWRFEIRQQLKGWVKDSNLAIVSKHRCGQRKKCWLGSCDHANRSHRNETLLSGILRRCQGRDFLARICWSGRLDHFLYVPSDTFCGAKLNSGLGGRNRKVAEAFVTRKQVIRISQDISDGALIHSLLISSSRKCWMVKVSVSSIPWYGSIDNQNYRVFTLQVFLLSYMDHSADRDRPKTFTSFWKNEIDSELIPCLTEFTVSAGRDLQLKNSPRDFKSWVRDAGMWSKGTRIGMLGCEDDTLVPIGDWREL